MKELELGNMMMGMDDTIDFFREISQILMDNDIEIDTDFPNTYTKAMNRLRYEREKSYGSKKKRIKKIYGSGYLERCGNCGFGLNNVPHYEFCPNCGYRIKKLGN